MMLAEGGEDEMSEADCEVSSSDDDLQALVEKTKAGEKARKLYQQESSDEEVKEPKSKRQRVADSGEVREMGDLRQPEKDEIAVEFLSVQPNPAYYHNVKALLNGYLDGEQEYELDYIGLTDYICERASIGQMVVSPLEKDQDPELMPELQKLSDEEFEKAAMKYYEQRDVFAFSSIVSLTYKENLKKMPFFKTIYDYVLQKAEKHCPGGKLTQFKQILQSKNVGLLFAERMLNLPQNVVPSMHIELPEDLEFTKQQDDIKDPKEFNYSYLLVLSKYTLPQSFRPSTDKDKAFYKWEDQVLWPASELSFTYPSTFRYIDDEGNKHY